MAKRVILEELVSVNDKAFNILLAEIAQLEHEGICRDTFILRGRTALPQK